MGDYYYHQYWIDANRHNNAIEFVRDGHDVRVVVHASRATEDYRQFCLRISGAEWQQLNRQLEQNGTACLKMTVGNDFWDLFARRISGQLFLKLNFWSPMAVFMMTDELVLAIEHLDQAVS